MAMSLWSLGQSGSFVVAEATFCAVSLMRADVRPRGARAGPAAGGTTEAALRAMSLLARADARRSALRVGLAAGGIVEAISCTEGELARVMREGPAVGGMLELIVCAVEVLERVMREGPAVD